MIQKIMELKSSYARRLNWLSGDTVYARWQNRPYTNRQLIMLIREIHLKALMPIIETLLVLLPFRIGFPMLDLLKEFQATMKKLIAYVQKRKKYV